MQTSRRKLLLTGAAAGAGFHDIRLCKGGAPQV